jgi:hypothetical protein
MDSFLTHRILGNALFHVSLHCQDELHQEVKEQEDQGRIEEELKITVDTELEFCASRETCYKAITYPRRTYGVSVLSGADDDIFTV